MENSIDKGVDRIQKARNTDNYGLSYGFAIMGDKELESLTLCTSILCCMVYFLGFMRVIRVIIAF